MSDLRARRHEQTRAALVAAAHGLFEAHGYGSVTMAEIADAAGVSRSTAYRRFPTKDDILLETPRRWLAIWDGRAAELENEPPPVVLAECARAVAAHVDECRDEILVAFRALAEAPQLAQSTVATTAWHDRLVALVAADPGSHGLDDIEMHVIAGAYNGAIDATMGYWVSTGGNHSVAAAIDTVLERLRPIWPD